MYWHTQVYTSTSLQQGENLKEEEGRNYWAYIDGQVLIFSEKTTICLRHHCFSNKANISAANTHWYTWDKLILVTQCLVGSGGFSILTLILSPLARLPSNHRSLSVGGKSPPGYTYPSVSAPPISLCSPHLSAFLSLFILPKLLSRHEKHAAFPPGRSWLERHRIQVTPPWSDILVEFAYFFVANSWIRRSIPLKTGRV